MDSDLRYTITELPLVWPGERTAKPRRAPFKTQWTRTMRLLRRELRYLGARSVEIAIDLPRGQMDLRQDGMLRADARPRPPVVLSFLAGNGHRQAYPCDTFSWWEDNLYAIAVVLQDLRRAERYGVQSTLLRAGFKALPASTAPVTSAHKAAETIAWYSDVPSWHILSSAEAARAAVRTAIGRTHPDKTGGRREQYDLVDTARSALSAHFAEPL